MLNMERDDCALSGTKIALEVHEICLHHTIFDWKLLLGKNIDTYVGQNLCSHQMKRLYM